MEKLVYLMKHWIKYAFLQIITFLNLTKSNKKFLQKKNIKHYKNSEETAFATLIKNNDLNRRSINNYTDFRVVI